MGRRTRSGRRSAASGGAPRTARGQTVTKGPRARGVTGAVYCIEIAGPWEPAAIDALELELRDLARRYGAEIEDFRVEMRC